MIVLAIETGLRRGELLGLTWHRIDLEKRFALIRTARTARPAM
jgi:integrase